MYTQYTALSTIHLNAYTSLQIYFCCYHSSVRNGLNSQSLGAVFVTRRMFTYSILLLKPLQPAPVNSDPLSSSEHCAGLRIELVYRPVCLFIIISLNAFHIALIFFLLFTFLFFIES